MFMKENTLKLSIGNDNDCEISSKLSKNIHLFSLQLSCIPLTKNLVISQPLLDNPSLIHSGIDTPLCSKGFLAKRKRLLSAIRWSVFLWSSWWDVVCAWDVRKRIEFKDSLFEGEVRRFWVRVREDGCCPLVWNHKRIVAIFYMESITQISKSQITKARTKKQTR